MPTSRGELLLANTNKQKQALERAQTERDALLAQLRCETLEDLRELDIESLTAILQRIAVEKYATRNLHREYVRIAAAPESV